MTLNVILSVTAATKQVRAATLSATVTAEQARAAISTATDHGVATGATKIKQNQLQAIRIVTDSSNRKPKGGG